MSIEIKTTFADELRTRAEYTRKVNSVINAICKKLEEVADDGFYFYRNAYRLQEKPESQFSKKPKHNHEFDNLILKKLTGMGLECEIVYEDLNPHPEFGQEGFDACYRVDVSWKK